MIDIEKLKKFYNEGWSYESLAAEFGTTAQTMQNRCAELRKQKVLKPRSQGHKPIDFANSLAAQEREEKVIKMRKAGLSNQEIADALKITLRGASNIASRLIKAGRLEKRVNRFQ